MQDHWWYEEMLDVPIERLITRKPAWRYDLFPETAQFSISKAWIVKWSDDLPVNGELIMNPSTRPPGYNLHRHEWVLLNRLRTNNGRGASLMHRWGLRESPYYTMPQQFQCEDDIAFIPSRDVCLV
jgi:hypothetical protein